VFGLKVEQEVKLERIEQQLLEAIKPPGAKPSTEPESAAAE
jgi:hypothetical protein